MKRVSRDEAEAFIIQRSRERRSLVNSTVLLSGRRIERGAIVHSADLSYLLGGRVEEIRREGREIFVWVSWAGMSAMRMPKSEVR